MIEEVQVQCPYCGEEIFLELDTSEGSQTYTEDCSVCCQPMLVKLRVAGGEFFVDVLAENG